MKKQVIILLSLTLISLVSAAPQLELPTQDLQPGETLVGKITLSSTAEQFAQAISSDNIEFLQGRKKVFMEHNIIFYNNTHYFYTYLNREGNFTFKINNILYKDASNELNEAVLEKNIFIENKWNVIKEEQFNETSNTTYYTNKTVTEILSVKPGFFFGTSSLEFTLENKGTSNITVSYNNNEDKLPLSPEQKVKITPSFQPNQTISFFEFLTDKNFSIPIIYLSQGEINQTPPPVLEIKAEPVYLHINLIAEQEKSASIELFNFIEENITGISITSNISIMQITNIEELETFQARETKNISLTFTSEKTGFAKGEILITYTADQEQRNLTIPIFAYILPSNSSEQDLANIGDFATLQNQCTDTGGVICSLGQKCQGNETYTGVFCCLGSCTTSTDPNNDPDEEGSYGWLIGLLILLFLAIVGFFAYRKFKKTQPPTPENKLAQKPNPYQKRISGGLERH
ncbi:hypothetical protein CMI37_29890 [Candidatus Pacearchaeota archaeon]|nr:hypothetical protein [Candidatus Pacearchaeota archaeon]|tara:strand:- start:252 stop:1631 length:1380 start_codon:yes stop_codon:yes gene_type:complete